MVFVAQGALPHVGQLDGAFRAGIHEPIAAGGMEFGSRDHFRQFLHVRWFDVDDIEALFLDVEVPQIDAKVVATYERLPVAVDRDAVDMVCMRIGVCPARHGSNHRVMVRHSRQLQGGGILE